MTLRPSVWETAPSGWVPLADLLWSVEDALGISQPAAARVLRQAIETGRIPHRIGQASAWLADDNGAINPDTAILEPGVMIPRFGRPLHVSDWKAVSWSSGSLDGYEIEVQWSMVLEVLSTQAAPPKKQTNAYNLAKEDAPLLAKMREAIVSGVAKSPTAAARRFAPHAAGGGTEESRAIRLRRGYIDRYGKDSA